MAFVIIYNEKLEGMLDSSEVHEAVKDAGENLAAAAVGIYLGERVLPEHNDYVTSFKVESEGRNVVVVNHDDTAFWVEFGAHAGGKTKVLGYAPLRRAIDSASAGL